MFEYNYLIFVVFSRSNNSLVVSLIDKHLLNIFLYYTYISKNIYIYIYIYQKISLCVLSDFYPRFQKIARSGCAVRVAPNEYPNKGLNLVNGWFQND